MIAGVEMVASLTLHAVEHADCAGRRRVHAAAGCLLHRSIAVLRANVCADLSNGVRGMLEFLAGPT